MARVLLICHFTVVCAVTWPMNASEAGGDLALIQASLLFSCKCKLVSIKTTRCTQQKQWGLYQYKVTFILAAIQRPGHWANNCKNGLFSQSASFLLRFGYFWVMCLHPWRHPIQTTWSYIWGYLERLQLCNLSHATDCMGVLQNRTNVTSQINHHVT